MSNDAAQAWWRTITAAELRELRRQVIELLGRSRLGKRPDLEDAAQEAMVVLLENRAAVNPANHGLLRYTFAVARNRLLDRLRRAQAGGLPDEGVADPAGTPDPGRQEERARISRFLYELDPLDRYILWRHLVDGQSVNQVAAEVGLYWHKVAGRINAAVRHLRRRLGESE